MRRCNHLHTWTLLLTAIILLAVTLLPASAQFITDNAPSDPVHAFAQDGDDIYVGGEFSSIGRDYSLRYIARWDGDRWNRLGDGINTLDGPVSAIAVEGESVYVGGSFTQAGSAQALNIAVWNKRTGEWSALDKGVGGTLRSGISAIAVHNGEVFVAGSFIAAGHIVAAYIVHWNGSGWERVGTGINNVVKTLHIDDGYLYAGGDFTIAGDIRTAGMARYDLAERRWEQSFVDIYGQVNAFASNERFLYVGGVFDSVAGRLANNIIRIDKSTGEWSPLYKGVYGYSYSSGNVNIQRAIESIVLDDDLVYVGGTLVQTTVRNGAADMRIGVTGIARWDGTGWSNMTHVHNPQVPYSNTPAGPRAESSSPPKIHALLLEADGDVIIGGEFATAWNNNYNPPNWTQTPAPNICRYHREGDVFLPFDSALTGSQARDGDPPLPVAYRGSLFDRFASPYRLIRVEDTRLEESGVTKELRRYLGSGREPGFSPSAAIDNPFDKYWQPIEEYRSNDNAVLTLEGAGDELYAGGTFEYMYGVRANGIAVWRDRNWYPIDDGSAVGVDGFVYAIAVHGTKVYVGGEFSSAGGVPAHNIAVWDRTTRTWSALGSGITGEGPTAPFVSAIVVREGEVLVGGRFSSAGGVPAQSVARWNGSSWSPLAQGIDGTVSALQWFRGNLYAGGSFSKAGTVTSNGIAYWDGSAWNGMDGGVDGFVNVLEIYTSPYDTSLAVGGDFTMDEGRIRNLVFWEGDQWQFRPSQAEEEPPYVQVYGEIRELRMIGTQMFVGGAFNSVSPIGTGSVGNTYSNIAYLDEWYWESPSGGAWIPIWHSPRGGLNGSVNAIAPVGDELFVAGDFTRTVDRSQQADHIAIWSLADFSWEWSGNPTPLAPTNDLVLHNDTLYAAGSFTSQEVGLFDVTNFLVRLTTFGWRTIPGLIQGTGFSLTSSDDQVVVGGTIISSDERVSVNVTRWNSDSKQWMPLTPGSGVASLQRLSFVTAVTSAGENVYIGGQFDIADTMTVSNVTCWNRETGAWTKLGDGLNGTVHALVTDENGTVYAGGTFSGSGNKPIAHVARWSGTEWEPLGEGIDGNVFTLLYNDGVLYAGGEFDSAGGVEAANVARWDIASQSWDRMGPGLDADFLPGVYSMSYGGGQLFAAGQFRVSGTDSIRNIARWNPQGWWGALGSGTDRVINAVVVRESDGAIFVGGHFLEAGSKPSPYVGLWQDPTLSVDEWNAREEQALCLSGMPNPFTDRAHLRLDLPNRSGETLLLELFDGTGRLVRTLYHGPVRNGGSVDFTVEGADLATGAYVLRVSVGGYMESIKLLKM